MQCRWWIRHLTHLALCLGAAQAIACGQVSVEERPDEACYDDDGDGYGDGCPAGPDCRDFDPAVPGPEACNGEDDDCDGLIDEDFGIFDPCVEGPCEGRRICADDGQGTVCETDGTDQCNGADDDCDGEIDESTRTSQRCLTDLYGVCAAGMLRCEAGAAVCAPGVLPDAIEEVCNGRDDDCDGVVDEVMVEPPCYPGPEGTEGVGVCHAGKRRCDAGAPVTCVGARTPAAERCDGVDEDCDGKVDEGLDCGCPPDASRACAPRAPAIDGLGACRGGEQACVDGRWGPCDGRVDPGPEICDGLDGDCDGLVDERAVGVDTPCAAGLGDCRAGGLLICRGGRLRCDVALSAPGYEPCDGQRDSDCDGVVGTSAEIGQPCAHEAGDGLLVCSSITDDGGPGPICVEAL